MPEELVVVRTNDMTIPSGLVGITPNTHKNVLIQVINPLTTMLVRALKVFIQSIVFLMPAVSVTNLLPASDFGHRLFVASSLSIGIAGMSILNSFLEILTDWDKKHPTLVG